MLEEGPHVPADAAPRGLSEALPMLWRGGGLTATMGETPANRSYADYSMVFDR
jgi:hypothetical protein